jgi:hypothetical protein
VKLKKAVFPNGVVAWVMSSSKYVQSDVQNIQEYLAALPGNKKLLEKYPAQFTGDYMPELYESPELDPIMEIFFQLRIGILRWRVELDRSDIINDVSMLSTYLCLPREGHFYTVFCVFSYLALHHIARGVFDPTYTSVDMGAFIKTDWKLVYG